MVRGGEQQVCTDNMDFVREKVKDWEIKERLHKVNPLTSHEVQSGKRSEKVSFGLFKICERPASQ